MLDFEFMSPTQFVFGRGVEEKVGGKLAERGAKKVLLHFGGQSAVRSGLIDRVCASLDAAGVAWVKLGGVRPNPEIELVREGVALCKKEGVDWVLAVGGGSVIDSAKAIANGTCIEEDVWELFTTKRPNANVLPIAVVLTIPAAGSEASKNTVISNDELGRKTGYANNAHRPKFAFMNPELTFTLPAYQTASGCVDIIYHTMERYFTPTQTDNSLTDRIAEGLLVSVRDAAQVAVKEPENYDARATLMWAGSLSHNGLTGAGRVSDFGSHKIEHELGGMFDVAHGAGLAAIWGSWARYVYHTDPARFAQFGEKVFGISYNKDTANATTVETAALAAIKAWEDWCRSIQMPVTLTELGIQPTDAQIQEMAEKCVYGRNGHIGFFQELDKEDIVKILNMAK